MVGVKESLSSLKAEYAAGSQVFVHKIESLEGSYSAIRRTRGDGNCFFRSYIFSYLEGLVERSDLAEAVR
jgi:ubiquitin thioesterase protein OTUB1